MPKRKVFITHYKGDRATVDDFITKWTDTNDVFIPKVLGANDNDDFIESTDTDYVMSQIRKKYLEDSTVTLVLLGTCTHSRRYVDWEIKSSLTQGDSTPNGLFCILLEGTSGKLPERFQKNWNSEGTGYAQFYAQPSSSSQLSGWIEEAFSARTEKSNLISNSQDMMKYNQKCKTCDETH
ncbi:MAG: TIR domain-containing protein [Bacteriovoracaceae bacterium]|jgi:hypothetical protein|nr:TIR domain-containing protein [Bacteriovoracaceae bacterium]